MAVLASPFFVDKNKLFQLSTNNVRINSSCIQKYQHVKNGEREQG